MIEEVFNILVNYKGSLTLAEVTPISNSIDTVYQLRFPDKYVADFMYDRSNLNWVSGNMELAEELSTYLHVSLPRPVKSYVETFGINIEGTQYYIEQNTAGYPNVFFIYSTNEMLFRIIFDQDGYWKADEAYNPGHVEKFAKMIQDKRSQL